MQNTVFSTNKTLNINGRLLDLNTPRTMGVLNLTPDSFYDGGRYKTTAQILQRVESMVGEKVDILDVGGYSTRPGAQAITEQEELDRVIPAIRLIVKNFPDVIVSIDTFRSRVARAAVGEGAAIINDISGGNLDPDMFRTVAELRVPYVLMHMRGDPQTMAGLTRYDDLLRDLLAYFHKKVAGLTEAGVKDVIVDPGFGFAKTREQNFQLLKQLDMLAMLGKPVLVGLSRKSMVWKTLEITPEEALNGTSALHAIAVMKGAAILRVHDVKEAREVIRLVHPLR